MYSSSSGCRVCDAAWNFLAALGAVFAAVVAMIVFSGHALTDIVSEVKPANLRAAPKEIRANAEAIERAAAQATLCAAK